MAELALINAFASGEERYGPLWRAGSFAPPLHMCALGAYARQRGIETIIEDPGIFENRSGEDEIVRTVLAHKPRVAGLSSTTISTYQAFDIARRLRAADKNLVICIGGSHATAVPRETLERCPAIDFAVIGEGEQTIVEVVAAVRDRRSLGEVAGLLLRDGHGGFRQTPPRTPIEDLDTLPLPAWDMLNGFPDAYTAQLQATRHHRSTSVITSRGCCYTCSFCANVVFGRKMRFHSGAWIVRMMEELRDRYGISDVQFEDDTLFVKPSRLHEMCKLMKERKLNMTWSCQARLDEIRKPELVELAKEVGLWHISLGVESVDERILSLYDKRIRPDKALRSIKVLRDRKIKSKGYFILANPLETRESLRKVRDFILSSGLDDIALFWFTPYPGTPFYNEIEKYGQIDYRWERMSGHNPVFVPHGLSEQEIDAVRREILWKFYFRPRPLLSYLGRARDFGHFVQALRAGGALLRYVLSSRNRAAVNGKGDPTGSRVTPREGLTGLAPRNSPPAVATVPLTVTIGNRPASADV